jgi:hypothetical protein
VASDAILSTLEHVLRVLTPLGHPVAVMGGVSLAAWRHIRATHDVDLLIAVDLSEIDAVVSALCANGCRPKRSTPILVVGQHHFLQLLYTPPDEFYDVQFDLLLAENELQKSAIARRVKREVSGIAEPIEVLSVEDLILFKLVAGRMIDRADAAMLLRENRDAIDFKYLDGWVSKLDLGSDYATIWSEAFPNGNG